MPSSGFHGVSGTGTSDSPRRTRGDSTASCQGNRVAYPPSRGLLASIVKKVAAPSPLPPLIFDRRVQTEPIMVTFCLLVMAHPSRWPWARTRFSRRRPSAPRGLCCALQSCPPTARPPRYLNVHVTIPRKTSLLFWQLPSIFHNGHRRRLLPTVFRIPEQNSM